MSSPPHRLLRLGTRGSPLARAQAGRIAQQLCDQDGRPAVLVTVATPGDESTAPIERLGTTGVFTTTLREALLDGAVDRKSTRLNSSHDQSSYAVFCLKKK